VLLPRIEYRLKSSMLSEKESHKMTMPFRKMVRHSLKLAISLPNVMFNLQGLLDFFNPFQRNLINNINLISNILNLPDGHYLKTILYFRLENITGRKMQNQTQISYQSGTWLVPDWYLIVSIRYQSGCLIDSRITTKLRTNRAPIRYLIGNWFLSWFIDDWCPIDARLVTDFISQLVDDWCPIDTRSYANWYGRYTIDIWFVLV